MTDFTGPRPRRRSAAVATPSSVHGLPGRDRARRHRLVRVALVGLLLAGTALSPGAEQPAQAQGAAEREARLEELRGRIERLARDLEEARSERSEARRALRDVERQMAGLRESLDGTRTAVAETRAGIERLQAQRRSLREELNAERAALSNLVEATYRLGRTEYVKLLLSQRDPAKLDRALVYYRYLARARQARIGSVNATLARLAEVETELAQRSRELETLASRQQRELDQLASRGREREALIEQLGRELVTGEREMTRLKADAARLEELVRELRRYLEEFGDIPEDARFASMKGSLPLPVSTPIRARFGEPRGGGGQRWEGLFLGGEGGEPVRAVFRGRVVYSGWFRGFGQLLIIDHGDGYMSLYGHNRQLYREVGDGVETGEPIASLGSSGGLREPGLYFEIRENGRPTNPLIWCRRS